MRLMSLLVLLIGWATHSGSALATEDSQATAPLPGMSSPAAPTASSSASAPLADPATSQTTDQAPHATNPLFASWMRLKVWVYQQQSQLHRQLTLAIQGLRHAQHTQTTLWSLVWLSFLYGVFHAAGPGHGKAVLTAYLTTRPEKVSTGILLSSSAALMQGLVAITLVTVLIKGFGLLTRQTLDSVIWVERASFALVALLGAGLTIAALRSLWRARSSVSAQQHHNHNHSHNHDHSHTHDHDHQHNHEPHACEHCGQAHHISPDQMPTSMGARILTVCAIGIRPCSGAVLVLAVANLLGLWWSGIMATLAMSVGTALTVSTLALIATRARKLAQGWLGHAHPGWALLGRLARLTGGLIILALGLSLLLMPADAALNPLGVAL